MASGPPSTISYLQILNSVAALSLSPGPSPLPRFPADPHGLYSCIHPLLGSSMCLFLDMFLGLRKEC